MIYTVPVTKKPCARCGDCFDIGVRRLIDMLIRIGKPVPKIDPIYYLHCFGCGHIHVNPALIPYHHDENISH